MAIKRDPSAADCIVKKVFTMAANGNIDAVRFITERIEGKPAPMEAEARRNLQ